MEKDLKEILMQLLDTTNKLVEGQKRTDEHFCQIDKRLDNIEKDIEEIKEEAHITRESVNHNGEVLENLADQLTALHIVDVKY